MNFEFIAKVDIINANCEAQRKLLLRISSDKGWRILNLELKLRIKKLLQIFDFSSYSETAQYQLQMMLVAHLSARPFDEETAHELPWLLSRAMESTHCPDSPAIQLQLAELLLNFWHFPLFYNNNYLQLDLL